MTPFVTFLSDYGHADEFVGVCHGVIAQVCAQARVIDITHAIPRHDVRAGALALAAALPYTPPGIHLAVVDPGVGALDQEGGEVRRAVAVRAAREARVFVGPDNGLLALALASFGGAVEAVDIGCSRHRLEPVSATFHGRDIFAAVAGAIAAGEPLADAGLPLATEDLAQLTLPRHRREGDVLIAHALTIDSFGNVALNVDHDDLAGLKLGAKLAVEAGGVSVAARYVRAFADVAAGDFLVYEDSHRRLSLALNRGSAAAELGVGCDAELRIGPG